VRYTIEELAATARRTFGVSRHAVRGALRYVKQEGAEAVFTIEEAGRAIEQWAEKPVPQSEASKARGLPA
jgi:hypothetical protein